MKAKILGWMLVLTLLTTSVSAYYNQYNPSYSYPRLPYYPYREQANFYENADIARTTLNTNDLSARFFQDNLQERANIRNLDRFLGTQGYLNSLSNTFNQNRNLAFIDGYNINKEPLVTRKIKVNNPGKKNDFSITETINDGISGNFYRNNRFNDAINTNYNTNLNNFGAQAYNLERFNENALNRNTFNAEAAASTRTSTLKTLKATIGKGDLVILN